MMHELRLSPDQMDAIDNERPGLLEDEEDEYLSCAECGRDLEDGEEGETCVYCYATLCDGCIDDHEDECGAEEEEEDEID
jgi:hypothetical protein